ncbi:hypothetical protein B0H14DRAFT_3049987, partial [Mycena olivaceomarginata]
MGDAGAGGGRPALSPPAALPLVRPCLYVVVLVPALRLMRFLFLAFVLAPRTQQVRYIRNSWTCGCTAPHRLHTRLLLLLKRDREAEAELKLGVGPNFFRSRAPRRMGGRTNYIMFPADVDGERELVDVVRTKRASQVASQSRYPSHPISLSRAQKCRPEPQLTGKHTPPDAEVQFQVTPLLPGPVWI